MVPTGMKIEHGGHRFNVPGHISGEPGPGSGWR